MGKKRNLNGLANSLEQRYFSTLFYWDKAYMADWILNTAMEKGVTDIQIDILHDSVNPKELEIKPIIAQLYKLRETIKQTLESNDFPDDFIVDAKFQIYISQKYKVFQLLTCQALLKDRDGRVYEGKIYTEKAYEIKFKVFPVSLFERMKRALKN